MIGWTWVYEGGRIPLLHGVAYWDVARRQAVCTLVPLNYPVGWIRKCWFALMQGPAPMNWEAKLDQARRDGEREGYNKGMLQERSAWEERIRQAAAEFRRKPDG